MPTSGIEPETLAWKASMITVSPCRLSQPGIEPGTYALQIISITVRYSTN